MSTEAAANNGHPDNSGESDYRAKIAQVAGELQSWRGPIVIISHQDPDGDALGSGLALSRALRVLEKDVLLVLQPPRFLRFLVIADELTPELAELPPATLLVVLDVEVGERATGAPIDGAEMIINLDHHGTNRRYGDIVCVEPARAATAHIVKDVIDAMPVPWTEPIATACLVGILTDTGMFRFANTSPEVLAAAGSLIASGVDYPELVDQLQLRHKDYFRMLGLVMATIEFPLGGLVALARHTLAMKAQVGESDDDSDDYVGLIRYAEGTKVAILLKEREPNLTKVSVRAREGISAQAICVRLGGGGHIPAAGATIHADIDTARDLVIDAVAQELGSHGLPVERARL